MAKPFLLLVEHLLPSGVFGRGWVSEEANSRKDAAPNGGGVLRALFRGIVQGIRKIGTGAVVKSRSLNWRLGMSTLAAVLPLAAFALIIVGWIAHSEREEERRMLVGDAYSLADAVGREINAYFLLSAALSHSRPLQHGDLTGFVEQARNILHEAPGATLIVSTPDGNPVLTIPPLPSDSPLLRNRAALVSRAIDSGLRRSLRRQRRPRFARAAHFDRNSGLSRPQARL